MTRTARAGPGRAGSFLANVVQMEIGAPGQALSQDQALLFYYLEVAAPPVQVALAELPITTSLKTC